MARSSFNSLKRRVLTALEDGEPRSVVLIAELLGFRRPRPLYIHMLRYRAWGLVRRARRDYLNRVSYRITRRGQTRLRWLEHHTRK
jgi:hypothetical protein